VWFTPEEFAAAGLNDHLAEMPTVKDIWWSNNAEVLSYPPIPDEFAEAGPQLLFSGVLQERYPNPESSAGATANFGPDARFLLEARRIQSKNLESRREDFRDQRRLS
jgi:hypothetical protein